MTPYLESVTSITLGSYALLACICLPELIETNTHTHVTNVSQGPASLARTLVKISAAAANALNQAKRQSGEWSMATAERRRRQHSKESERLRQSELLDVYEGGFSIKFPGFVAT